VKGAKAKGRGKKKKKKGTNNSRRDQSIAFPCGKKKKRKGTAEGVQTTVRGEEGEKKKTFVLVDAKSPSSFSKGRVRGGEEKGKRGKHLLSCVRTRRGETRLYLLVRNLAREEEELPHIVPPRLSRKGGEGRERRSVINSIIIIPCKKL